MLHGKLKRMGHGYKKGLLYFSGGIETIAPYFDEQTWDENTIVKRGTDLSAKALSIW